MHSGKYLVALILGILVSSCGKDRNSEPSAAVKILLDRCLELIAKDRDSSLYYAHEALRVSKAVGDFAGEDRALVLPTMIYVNGGEMGALTDSLAEGLLQQSQESGSAYGIAKAKSALGILAFRKGNFKRAIPLLKEVVEMDRVAGRGASLYYDLLNLGRAYGAFGFLNAEMQCYRQALLVCDSLRLEHSQPRLLASVGSCLFDLGYPSYAKRCFEGCISWNRIADPNVLADAYTGLSMVHRSFDVHDSASLYLKLSDSILLNAGESVGFYRNRLEAARIEFERSHYQGVLDSLAKMEREGILVPDSLAYFEMIQLKGLAFIGVGQSDSSTKYWELYDDFARRIGSLKMIAENYRITCDVLAKFGFMDRADTYCSVSTLMKDSVEQSQATFLASTSGISEDFSPIASKPFQWSYWVWVVLLGLIVFGACMMGLSYYRKNRLIGLSAPLKEVNEDLGGGESMDQQRFKPSPLSSDTSQLALKVPPILYKDVICAKAQGHFFWLLYVDPQGKVKELEVDTRTPHKLPLSLFQRNSMGRLLESKRGCLVNPAFIELSGDKLKIHLVLPEAVALIETNVARKKATGDGFFEDYPLPIASTPGKNFVDRLVAWHGEFGGEADTTSSASNGAPEPT